MTHTPRRPSGPTQTARPAGNTRGRRAGLALLPLAVAGLLAGCSLFDPKTDPQAGSNLVPRVTLKGDEIVIQPEVLRYRKSEGPVTITWRLDARSGVTLADPAVVIEDPRRKPLAPEPALAKLCPKGYDSPEGVFSCGRGERAGDYQCKYANAKPGCYKYTMRLMIDGTLKELDPPIIGFMD